MGNIVRRIPIFLLLLLLLGLFQYCAAYPEEASTKLLSGDARAIGQGFGKSLGFGSMLILGNFMIGMIVSLLAKSAYWGSVVAIVLGFIWGLSQPYNGILQMITLGGGATLLILQVKGKLKIHHNKKTSSHSGPSG
jgi:hypothetical protein